MRAVVFGEKGFVGSYVTDSLSKAGHEVVSSYIDGMRPDLLSIESIKMVLSKAEPDVIINSAGVVTNDTPYDHNRTFSLNILEAVRDFSGKKPSVVILGSAAEYGIVNQDELPIGEDAELRGESEYAVSKKREVAESLEFAQENKLSVSVARVFNPIGKGMKSKFLLPSLVQQLSSAEKDKAISLSISRLDSIRDYVDVRDVADAIVAIAADAPRSKVYNVGSGVSTSNEDLIRGLAGVMGLSYDDIIIDETMQEPEPLYAAQADIRRIRSELAWHPKRSILETLQWVVEDE